MTKFCTDCRRERPLSAFTKNRRNRDGLAFYCAECANARSVASRRSRLGPPKHRGAFRPKDVPDGRKWCPECGTVKAVDQFPRNRRQRGGLGTYCKPCHNRITRENVEKHGGARNYHLRRRYGITAEYADRLFAEQGGLCAICREAPAAHVDHDHRTKRVRGLLCFNCNGALGQFRDRTELMVRAAWYVTGKGSSEAPMPPFAFGLSLGATQDPRPPGEPAPWDLDDQPPWVGSQQARPEDEEPV